jgi:hypothetical protein
VKQIVYAVLAGVATLAVSSNAHELKPWHYPPKPAPEYAAPVVYQAAGPDAASIQSTVDRFRAALGANNGNVVGPLDAGRREINWDGGGSTATAIVPTPFNGFLVNRGASFTTPGTGFVQAPLDGLASTFNNAEYATIFQPFSPVRLFSALESNVTIADFFVPGGGDVPALVSGFGAVFSDVDQPDGRPRQYGDRTASTSMRFYDVYGRLLYSSAVPSSPGDASLSFFGVIFEDARIARVKIVSGDVAPGPDDKRKDVVMMDDFIFGEPKAVK